MLSFKKTIFFLFSLLNRKFSSLIVRCQSNNHTNLYQKQDSPASSSSEDFNVDVNTNTRNNDNIR